MKFQTLDIIEKTIVRIESALEVDTTLDEFERDYLKDALEDLVTVYENSKPSNPS